MPPTLWVIVPCYNEGSQGALPRTAGLFLGKLDDLMSGGAVARDSRVCFVDDGSSDDTWDLVERLCREDERARGIRLSRNFGHQSAVCAGLVEATDKCDITISIDCDGQDDLNAMDEMIAEYQRGSEIVYGVRKDRSKDSRFKRGTAQAYYRLLAALGAEITYNHADYRLVSARVLHEFEGFHEVNLFLRGLFPLIGFKSSTVSYDRGERAAGESHYPLSKMIHLAVDGVTSLSVKPIRIITLLGMAVALASVALIIWTVIVALTGNAVSGWASTLCVVLALGGIQLVSLGIVGEYIGKIYLEVKRRPRYIVMGRTWDEAPDCVRCGAKTGCERRDDNRSIQREP